jgi:hypothetical protein
VATAEQDDTEVPDLLQIMGAFAALSRVEQWAIIDDIKEPEPRPPRNRTRKTSLTDELKAARRAGFTAATLPSGTRVSIEESTADDASNPWDEAAAAKLRSADVTH